MAKQRAQKMQYQLGSLQAMQQLENRTEEQLLSESKHRAAARAVLGARAAERYDAETARKYFNEAMAGVHPQERPALRQMAKASLALAERRPDDLKEAVQKLGHEPPSGRQLFMLRLMGLVAPPKTAGLPARIRGIFFLIVIVVAMLAVGFGIAELIGLAFGGFAIGEAFALGTVIVLLALGGLALFGRRRQAKQTAARSG